MKNNIVGWFEIPVTDMERAITFYQTVLGVQLQRNQMESVDMAWFPHNQEGYGAGGTLIYHEEYYKPSTDGIMIYLSSPTDDVANERAKVEAAGGKVILEKTQISDEHGYYGLLIDSEGNRIAFHSAK